MRPSSSTSICLLLLAIGIWRASQLYHSSTEELRPKIKSQRRTPDETVSRSGDNDDVVMADEPSNLFYYVQVSDLHLSKYESRGHTQHFLHFLQSALPAIKPEFVVVTGDLTDAKDLHKIKTMQYVEEWEVYQAAVDQGIKNSHMPWYDMRGNHDCFNLPSWESQQNMYRAYGKSASLLEEGDGVYSWHVEKDFGRYQFVAIDACPKKGPARPINFFGYLTSKSMDKLIAAVISENTYNHTFMFAHYPTTTMMFGTSTEGYRFRDIAQRFSVYMCGHLHRLVAGLGSVLKSYDRRTDSLELELADLKDHGAYRVMAVDHDLISFVDVELPLEEIRKTSNDALPKPIDENKQIQWPKKIETAPAVLITNPKDARYLLETKEPYKRQRMSTHLRFLVFSETNPAQLKVRILVDGHHHPFPAIFVGKDTMPLWVSAWEPNDFYDMQTHTLRIEVEDDAGRVGESEIPFRMDDGLVKIGGGFGEWVIGHHVASLLRALSILGIAGMLMALVLPRLYIDYIHSRRQQQQIQGADIDPLDDLRGSILHKIHQIDQQMTLGPFQFVQRHTLVWCLRFMKLPTEQPSVWYGTFLFLVTLLALPWFRAEFIPSDKESGHGTLYLWGLVFGDNWVPLADTWKFAFVQVALDTGVFFLLLAWRSTDAVDLHCRGSLQWKRNTRQLNNHAWFKACEALYWLWRASELTALASFYGGVSTLVLNVCTYWLLFVAVQLVWGKDGIIQRKQKHERVSSPSERCGACQASLLTQVGVRLGGAASPPSSVHVGETRNEHGPRPDNHARLSSSMARDDTTSSNSSSSSNGSNSPRRRAPKDY